MTHTSFSVTRKDESGHELCRIWLDDEVNVNTICPRCNKEHQISFWQIGQEDFCFFSMAFNCDECTAEILKKEDL